MKLDYRVLVGALAVGGIALAAVSGATGTPEAADPAPPPAGSDAGTAALPEGHPEIPPAPSSGPTVTGVVDETLQAGGYTYARLTTDEGEVWAAGPETELSAGETVALAGVTDMGAFTSPSLGRSFERLLFTDRFVTGDGGAAGTAPVGAFRGTVKRAVPASRYIYLEVETEEGLVWLAAPGTEVDEGDEVRWDGGTLMRDFESTTLGRTFDRILFVGALEVG